MLPDLRPDSAVGDIYNAFHETNGVLHAAPDAIASMSHCLSLLNETLSDAEVASAVMPVFAFTLVDRLLGLGLLNARLQFAQISATTSKVNIQAVADNGGSFLVDYPSLPPILIGEALDTLPVVKTRLAPLIAAISTLDATALRSDIAMLKATLETELSLVRVIEPELRSLLQQYSRWEGSLYIANYGETAALLESSATMEVRKSRFNARHRLPCYILEPSEPHLGLAPGPEPLAMRGPYLLAAGTDARLSYVTNQRQGEMPRGGEIRGIWNDGLHQARMIIPYVSIGMKKNKKLRTPWIPFVRRGEEGVF